MTETKRNETMNGTINPGTVIVVSCKAMIDKRRAIMEAIRRNRLEREQRMEEGLDAMNVKFRKDVLELLKDRGLLREASLFSACSAVRRSDSSPRSYCRLCICRRCNRRESIERYNNYYSRLVEFAIAEPIVACH